MGCYPPLGKFVSKALGKCNGRQRWREGRLDFDYALAYPPTETHYMRPVARTVTFASNNSIYVIPPSSPPPQPQPQQQNAPEPQQPQTPPGHEPEQQHQQDPPESQPPPQPQTTEQPEQPDPPAQTQDDAPPKGPKRGKKKQPGRVRFGPEPPPPPQQQQEQEQAQQSPGNIEKPPDHGPPHGAAPAPAATQGQQGYLLRYTPSPLPRWEATPRRHEYFSGEYRSYYPTPVREGIYRIATDANRLTTIFSEENPNACTIV
ncbi:proline-rich protein 2 [Sorghum bicolor]|uniref:Uncharacterized protein n=1 Tax=Sorghum bicolor TaxID=4558 RepID=C5XZY1_SORBI|nr:proline-rich protein 2 [Sorghum bicolor]EES05635.1 hypothetical protein SORBI_3004G262800 [Sorghum bicolor]|eukprot:XP_002452659.1 proline-rich protein 2 [Sorghum bicolor]